MDPNKALQAAKEALDQAIQEKKQNKAFLASIGPIIKESLEAILSPFIEKWQTDTKDALKNLKVEPKVTFDPKITVPEVVMPKFPEITIPAPVVTVNVPPIKVPDIFIPEIKVPAAKVTVTVPQIKIPDIIMPEEMQTRGFLSLIGWDKAFLNNPLPVQLRDAKGNPVTMGGSGGVTVSGGSNFPMSVYDPVTNALKVTGSFSISASNSSTQAIDSSGNPYSAANPLPVSATFSGSTVITLINNDGLAYNSDNPLPITGSITTTPGATFFASDAILSVNVISPIAQGDAATAVRVVIAGNSDASVVVNSGTITSVTTVGSITNSLAANIVDSSGVAYTTSNPLPIGDAGGSLTVDGTVTVSGVTASVQAALIDSSGVQYSGSNPLSITGTVAATKSGTWAIDNPVAQGDAATALRVVIAGNSDASVVVNSGTITSVTTVGSVTNSVATAIIDSSGVQYSTSNPLPIGDAGGSLTIDGTVTVSDITASVKSALIDSTGVQYSGSNPLPVGIQSALNQGDAATALRVVIAGNSDASVSATQVGTWNIGTVTTVTGITNTLAANIVDSSGVAYTTSNPLPIGDAGGSITVDGTVVVSSITATTAATIVDSSGVAYSGSNPVPTTASLSVAQGQGDAATAMRVVIAGNSDASVTSTAQGLNETTSGVLRVVQMTDSNSSVNITTFNGNAPATGTNEIVNGVLRVMEVSGNITSVNVVTFNGNAPAAGLNETNTGVLRVVQMTDSVSSVSVTNTVTVTGALSTSNVVLTRQTNPTAVAADYVPVGADDLGRQLTRPFQVRDLVFTAFVALANGTETTLLAASAGNLHDLMWIMAANTSTVTQAIDIREVTAGNIVMNLQIPANGVAGIAPPMPWPQSATGNNWTVDGPDNTGSTINVTALFIREI